VATATLDDILAKAYEDAGLDENDVFGDKGFISSGNLALDFILGGQGFPRGRSVELYGLSQTGKTTTAAMAAVQAQLLGLRVLYLDFEQALDEPYLNALGVNTRDRRLFVPFPASSLEHGAEVATQVARTGEVGLIVFDSVAAMTPRSSAEEDKDSRTLAMERARLLGNLLSKLNPILARTGTCAIFINHLRDVIETSPVRPGMPKRTTTPGGTALKFYSSVRVKFTIVKTLKAERIDPLTSEKISEPHSVLSRAEVTKNKIAPPFQTAELYLELGLGFNNTYSAMQVLIGNKVVKKAGAFYQFPQELYHPNMTTGSKGPSVQGLQSVLDIADTFPEWEQLLVDRAVSMLPRVKVTVSLPVIETDGEAPEEDSIVVDEPSVQEPLVQTALVQEPVVVDPEPTVQLPVPPPVASGNGQTIRFLHPPGARR
jgi:protein RecA